MFFRGRSILFKEQGEVLLLRFANDLEEYGKVEQMPKLEGKKMFLYLSPKKAGVAKKSQQKMDREKREAEAKAAAQAERDANADKLLVPVLVYREAWHRVIRPYLEREQISGGSAPDLYAHLLQQ